MLIYFDYDCEMLLYSLEIEDNNYSCVDYLIEHASRFDEENISNTIKSFMIDYVRKEINRYINEKNYNDWKVFAVDNGWKLANDKTHQYVAWNLYDYDEDCEIIQNKIIKFLDWNNQKG